MVCFRFLWGFSISFFLLVTSANGDGEIRTLDPLLARQVLSQLSYAPIPDGSLVWLFRKSLFQVLFQVFSPPVGLSGLEPPTSRLSGVRSNRLSYKPRLILQKLRCHIITLLYMFSVKAKPLFAVKLLIKSGSHLLSHAVSSIVPSAA